LTTLFGTIESAEVPLIEAAARKRNGWLPLLTVLFLISYALMTMLIVEQGQTIESQRALIRELLTDSKELSAAKANANQQKTAQAPLSARPQQTRTAKPVDPGAKHQNPVFPGRFAVECAGSGSTAEAVPHATKARVRCGRQFTRAGYYLGRSSRQRPADSQPSPVNVLATKVGS
jgi:hypothetical protein